jgi:hypothetical protein
MTETVKPDVKTFYVGKVLAHENKAYAINDEINLTERQAVNWLGDGHVFRSKTELATSLKSKNDTKTQINTAKQNTKSTNPSTEGGEK